MTTSLVATRPRRLLRAVAVVSCVPYLALKVAWVAGSRVGIPDGSSLLEHRTSMAVANSVSVVLDSAVIVLALVLTRPWGLRVPAWLLAFPVWVATGLLAPIMTGFPLQLLVRTLGGSVSTAADTEREPFLDECDAVLGVLRNGDSTVPAPTLAADLDDLLRRTRATGLRIRDVIDVAPETLPPVVSREAYRIVQEGLSNALKHAADKQVTLHIKTAGEHLDITLENPLRDPGEAPRRGAGNCATSHNEPADDHRPGGHHGLPGIRDRAHLLGGTAHAGPTEDTWRLHVRLPRKGPT
ncbi:hypothetical protein OG828_37595 [Streptomyces sp. NBC_00457]|uniref:sensor histidine kinase n=1 Tax=Streptomyces sp. NBC_00457 TaxID=2975748 RepID=UPI002E1DD964